MSLTLLPPPPLSHEAFQPLHRNGSMDGLGWLGTPDLPVQICRRYSRDGWKDGWMDGWVDGWMESGWIGLDTPPDFPVLICRRYSREGCANWALEAHAPAPLQSDVKLSFYVPLQSNNDTKSTFFCSLNLGILWRWLEAHEPALLQSDIDAKLDLLCFNHICLPNLWILWQWPLPVGIGNIEMREIFDISVDISGCIAPFSSGYYLKPSSTPLMAIQILFW